MSVRSIIAAYAPIRLKCLYHSFQLARHTLKLGRETKAYERNKARVWDDEMPNDLFRPDYVPIWEAHWEAIEREFLPIVRAQEVTQAVDLGCGQGWLARKLAKHFEKVYAIDIGPNRLEYARSLSTPYPNIDFICADVAQAPEVLPHSRYFFVTMSGVLSHNCPKAVKGILTWIDSVCAVGSYAYLDEAWSLGKTVQEGVSWWWYSLPQVYSKHLAGWDLTFYGIKGHPSEARRQEVFPLYHFDQRLGKGILAVKVR